MHYRFCGHRPILMIFDPFCGTSAAPVPQENGGG